MTPPQKRQFSALLLNPVTIFALIFALLVARSWSALLLPEMPKEDGRDLLAFFFNSPHPRFFHLYNDYFLFVPSVIAWGATRGPIILAPYIFALAAFGFAALGMFMISRPQFVWLVPNTIDRAIIAVLLAVLPLGRGYLIHSLEYSLWSLLFLLVALLAYPLPKSALPLALRSIAIVLCIVSHPLSIVVVPICIIHLVLEKGWPQRLCIGLFLLVILFYQLFGVSHSTPLTINLHSFALAAKLFFTRVLFETISGANISATLFGTLPGGGDLLGIMVLLFFVFLLLTGDSTQVVRWTNAFALLLMFGMVFTSVASRISAEFLANIHNPYFQRYFYVSKLLFAVLLLSQLLPRLRHGIASVSLSAKCAILLLIALCLFHTNRVNQLLYQSSVTEGQRVKAFLASVQANLQKARAGLPYTSEWVLRREGKWSFALNIDRHLGREHNNNSLARTGS